MTVSLRHGTVASGSNNPSKQVSVDAWNNEHALTGTANQLVGFDESGLATEVDPNTLGSPPVASRGILAAVSATNGIARYLVESGREGTFVFDDSDLSAEVTADTLQGVYVAPSSDTTGASGAWVRSFDDAVQAHWFGLIADGVTDDRAAIVAAMSVADTIGRNRVKIRSGSYAVSASLAPPSSMIVEGDGKGTVLISTNAASDRFIFYSTSKSNITIRDMKLTPAGGGTGTRAAIQFNSCTDCAVENVIVEDITDNNGVFLVDCDRIVIDRLYFNGGGAGNGVYNTGGRNCKVTNSHAVSCFAGFTISSVQTDFDLVPVAPVRDVADTYGNVIKGCTVKSCYSQAYTITGAVANTISSCHAQDYAGASTHKAFQTKDTTGDSTRGNVIIGCTVKNYPAGFGGQQSSHTQFIGCTTRDNSTNAFELNSMSWCQVIGCSAYEFGQVGIWIGSGSVHNHFDNVVLETSTATATGISLGSVAGNDQLNNFDNVTTFSTLAKFINIAAAGSTGNRFGPGCRSNSNGISDTSNATQWPCLYRTDVVDLTSAAQIKHGTYQHRGMHVAAVRFVITTVVAGTTSPQVQAGTILSNAAIAAATVVTGVAGATVLLTRTSEIMTTASIPQVRVAVAASGGTPTGAGFLQFEGLPL